MNSLQGEDPIDPQEEKKDEVVDVKHDTHQSISYVEGELQVEELVIDKPTAEFDLKSREFELLSTYAGEDDKSKDIRRYFNKGRGSELSIKLIMSNLYYGLEVSKCHIHITLKDYKGKDVFSEDIVQSMTHSVKDITVQFKVDISKLEIGDYRIFIEAGGIKKFVDDFAVVDLPYTYTKFATLSTFCLNRLNKGQTEDDYMDIIKEDSKISFDSHKFKGVVVTVMCENIFDAVYEYEFIARISSAKDDLSSSEEVVLMQKRENGVVSALDKEDKSMNLFSSYFYFKNDGKSWSKGDYIVEVLLNEEVVVKARFSVGDKDVTSNFNMNAIQPKSSSGGKDLITGCDNALDKLNSMIGLKSIKEYVADRCAISKVNEVFKRQGRTVKRPQLHCAFMGNPGTGKTTVAKLIGQVYKELGLLSKGQVVIEERSTLIGQHWGSEGANVNAALDRAKGGILFIDEAYDLVTDHPNDPGKQVVSALLTALSDENNRDWMLVLAGYPKPMEKMLRTNPGFNSRLQRLHFADYKPIELMDVAKYWLDNNNYTMTEEASKALFHTISSAYSQKDDFFGNARYVNNLFETEILPAMATRLIESGSGDIDKIPFESMYVIEKPDIPHRHAISGEDKAIAELNDMVGLKDLKDSLDKHLNFVRFVNARRNSGISTTMPPMHMVFLGNPGTGKTSVADYLGEIYKSIGVLSIGNVISVSRADMVGEHIGETEQKMELILASARGNILFIDEAYTLDGDGKNDYGKIAMDTLLNTLGREALDMIVILAGYPKEMESLLSKNPGLKGRFPYSFTFNDYSEDELMQIAKSVIAKNNLVLSEEAEASISAYVKRECKHKDASFSNARIVVRLISTQIMPNMANRLMKLPLEEQSVDSLKLILPEDVPISDKEVKLINESLFDEEGIAVALAKLDKLVGLRQVKRAINEFVSVSRTLNQQGRKFIGGYPLKWSFSGRTGTGKSTVAEILGELLKAMNLLGKGHIVEINSDELYGVATARANELLTKRMEESQQGLLFVDGDASKSRSSGSIYDPNYLRMILATNTANMPGSYAIVIAEYESPRQGIAKELADSGVVGFDHTFIFEDYSVDELLEILKMKLEDYTLILDKEAEKIAFKYIENLALSPDKELSNARTMVLLARAVQRLTLLNNKVEGLVTASDIEGLAISNPSIKGQIGF